MIGIIYKSMLILGTLAISFVFTSPLKGESEGGVKWKETLAAAKKEGQVTIYGGEEITHPAILAAFKKRYPNIKVVTASGHSEIIQRVAAERRVGKFLVDLYSLGPGSVRTAYLANFLQPIRPTLMLPEVRDTSNWYGGKHFYGDPKKNTYSFTKGPQQVRA